MNAADQRGYRNYAVLVLTAAVITVGALLAWHALVRQHEFNAYQQRLIEQSVNGAAMEIASFIAERRHAVGQFAHEHSALLARLAADPVDDGTYAALAAKLQSRFPNYLAFTIADAAGEPLVEDFDLLVNEICERDLRTFARDGRYEPYIHPNPRAYHFDIMVRWEVEGREGVFFVSFKPPVLARLLRHARVTGHELMLLKRDVPGLVEVAGHGVRIQLPDYDGSYILPTSLQERIGYRRPVTGTAWELVDIPDARLVRERIGKIWIETGLLFAGFLAVAVAMYSIVREEERHRTRSEEALRVAKERLQHALDFNDTGLWDLDIGAGGLRLSDNGARLLGGRRPTDLEAYLDVAHPDDRAWLSEAIERCLREGEPCRLEHRLNGSPERWIEFSGSLEGIPGRGAGSMVGLLRDVTARKRQERDRLEAEKAQRETLIREVHHRIKNNLQGVVGLLRRYEARNPENKDAIDNAVSQLNSVSIVHGLHCRGEDDDIRIAELLNAICRSASGMTGVGLDPDVEPACRRDRLVSGDTAVSVALVVNELVFNAIKHGNNDIPDSVRVSLRCEGDRARFEVVNTGTHLPQGFDFAAGHGLGTGLSLVRSLVPRNGAKLIIEDSAQGVAAVLELQSPALKRRKSYGEGAEGAPRADTAGG